MTPSVQSAPMAHPARARKGNRYEILARLGEGGAGVVWRAYDHTLQRHVALKQVKGAPRSRQAQAAALAEAKALSAMHHPHIVTVFDVVRQDGGCFVVMELLEGETLEAAARTGKMLIQQFIPFATQVQEALIGAHAIGVLHGDLKPANVMLQWLPSGSMHVKLLDFGLASMSAQPSAAHGKQPVIGSLHFMSPEQFSNQPLTQQSDVYAAGCLYYYVLTRHFPFDGADTLQVMTAHLMHRVIPLQNLRPDLPPWLCDWVMWHCNKAPADRPSSVLAAFDHFNAQLWADSGLSGMDHRAAEAAAG